jgi:hypothetical protein
MHAIEVQHGSPFPLPARGEEREKGDREQSKSPWSLHYRQGFEEGHRAAVETLLKSLLTISEEFIATEPNAGPDLRRIVYRFEEHLERRIWRMSASDGFIEGGLGI